MPPSLPPEVLDLLSLGGKARLALPGGLASDVACAPLAEGLMLLVSPRNVLLEPLEHDPSCVLSAEGEGWRLVCQGRAVAGRRANAEALRAQIAYWLPEGGRADQLVVVRFLPERLEYHRGGEKFAGGVPGADFPEMVSAFWQIGVGGRWPWIAGMIAVNFVAGIFLEAETMARILLVSAALLPAFLLLLGLSWWNHGALAERWREGGEPEAAAWAVLRGWVGRAVLMRTGVIAMAAGLVLSVVTGFVMPALAPLTVFSSGFGILGPFYAVRHYFRAADRLEGA